VNLLLESLIMINCFPERSINYLLISVKVLIVMDSYVERE
jgi:hypothetical protein